MGKKIGVALLAACLSLCTVPVIAVFASSPSPSSPPTSGGASVSGNAVVAEAMKFLGSKYSYTGASPATGFSCIGFVSYVYRQLGVNMPGDLGDAMAAYPTVPESQLEPGDIVFFQNTWWAGVSHIGIYIGGGQIIHAENPRAGVTISSISGDPREGNYWTQHYLTAERPWSGAAVGPVSPPKSGAGTTIPTPPGTHKTRTVIVPSLNVRNAPSMTAGVITVVAKGTVLTVLGHVTGWVKVQLADGTIGWVVRAGVVAQSAAAPVQPATGSKPGASASTPTSPIVSTPKAPHKVKAPKVVTTGGKVQTTTIHVSGLRVHDAPSLSAPVVATLTVGERVSILGHITGWMKVGVSPSLIGWAVSQWVAPVKATPAAPKAARSVPKAHPSAPFTGGTPVQAGVRIHSAPSLTAPTVASTTAGMTVKVLGYRNGFAHVQSSSGVTGWIIATFVGGASPKPSTRTKPTSPTKPVAGTHVTATVRLHSGPGMKSRIIGAVAAGTHVAILRSSAGWDLVRLPNGQTGYVSAGFVAA